MEVAGEKVRVNHIAGPCEFVANLEGSQLAWMSAMSALCVTVKRVRIYPLKRRAQVPVSEAEVAILAGVDSVCYCNIFRNFLVDWFEWCKLIPVD